MERLSSAAPCLLIEAGLALYGERWQSSLSRDLGVSDRTVRRWIAGKIHVPEGIYGDILRIVHQRRADLVALLEPLRNAGPPK